MSGFVAALLLISAAPARAAESAWVSADHVQARLIAAGRDQETLSAGLEIRLADGWHSYWRMPGDAGLAPVFDWSGSVNAGEVAVGWPAPQRFETFGLYGFGYKDQVLFPLDVPLPDPAKPATLALALGIMVCKDICVPQNLSVSLDVPAQQAGDALAANTALIEAARSKVPVRGDLPALKIESAVAGPEAFVITAYAQHGFDETDVFIEAQGLALTAPPEIALIPGDIRRATLRIKNPAGVDNLSAALAGKSVSVTLVNRRRAVEKSFPF